MIDLKNIEFKYKNKEILKKFNLSIKKGERVVIVGSSGSGKTTLLRLIAGFIAPQKGEIYIDNKLVSKDKTILVPPYQRDVAMVFQDLALWTHMSVYKNIEFGLKIKKVAKKERVQRVKYFLDLVNLKGYENKKIDELSGGEKQRVALARSIILSPKILLMDEPLSSLDEKLNIELRKKIVQLQTKLGFTLVYVTHNKEETKVIAEKIIYL